MDVDEDHENGGSSNSEWECSSVLEGHETECKSVAYSSSGTLLASCSRDKTVWVWEGKCTHIYSVTLLMCYVAVLPDADFECMGVLMNHSQDVKCVVWHPTEEVKSLYSCSLRCR